MRKWVKKRPWNSNVLALNIDKLSRDDWADGDSTLSSLIRVHEKPGALEDYCQVCNLKEINLNDT